MSLKDLLFIHWYDPDLYHRALMNGDILIA